MIVGISHNSIESNMTTINMYNVNLVSTKEKTAKAINDYYLSNKLK